MLRDQLGEEPTQALVAFVAAAGDEWKQDVLNIAVERFERRLSEECSKLRVEMAEMGAAIRVEMAEMGAAIRGEMAEMGAAIRQEMAETGAAIRREMAEQGAAVRGEIAEHIAALRTEMAAGQVAILRWSFVFWIGQLAAIAGLVAFMLGTR